MFSKLKGVFSKFTSSTEEKKAAKVEKKEQKKAAKLEKKAQKSEKKEKPAKKDVKEKKGFFKRITEKKLDSLIGDLEEGLIQNNIAYDVVQKICSDLKKSDRKNVKKDLESTLKNVLEKPGKISLLDNAKGKKPYVILFVGVNGVGKTTTVGKLAKWIQKNKKSVVMAASDTFRAAAIEQLQTHADNLGVKLIKHKYGSDAAAVAFDAIDHAKSKGIDFVLIDSAGRSHANQDLMDELAKVKRVAKPDLTILVVDSLTGNDAVEQANIFNEKVGIDGSILTKTDADERGGAIISVGYETGKPILFLGFGQEYKDLKEFNPSEIVKQII